MTLETCSKYLDFVAAECDRHLRDGKVTDDELTQMIIEFDRFQEQCAVSTLPNDLKEKLNSLKLDYSIAQVERNYWMILGTFITFGIWGGIYWYLKQLKRKQALQDMKGQASSLSVYIKMNY